MKYDNREQALPVIATNVLKLAAVHADWRGVIHTHSGANARALQQHIRKLMPRDVRFGGHGNRVGRFIFHYGGPKERHMSEFMRDLDDNSIIVSPSLSEGFDGEGSIARWQCILKIPYLPRNSGEVKSRLLASDGELWYILQSVTALCQMYGRVNRGPTDYGITYVLDGGWNGFKWRLGKMLAWDHVPSMFREGVVSAKDFFFVYDKQGALQSAALHKSHPAVKAAPTKISANDILKRLNK